MALVPADRVLETFIRFRPDLLNVSRTALGQLRVVGGFPDPGGKFQGFALLIALYIAPENIDSISCARLVFGSCQPVEFVGEFLWYLDYAWHRFLWLVPAAGHQAWYLNLNHNATGVKSAFPGSCSGGLELLIKAGEALTVTLTPGGTNTAFPGRVRAASRCRGPSRAAPRESRESTAETVGSLHAGAGDCDPSRPRNWNFSDILERHAGCLCALVQQEVGERGLRALDLRRKYRLLANVQVDEQGDVWQDRR